METDRPINIQTEIRDNFLIISLPINVDNYSTFKYMERFPEYIEREVHQNVIIELSQIQHITSIIFGFLVSIYKLSDTYKFKLMISCKESKTLEMFRVLRLESMFTIYPTIEEAIQGCNESDS